MLKAAAAPLLLPPYAIGALMRPERRNHASRDQLVRRVRAEFEEMPRMRLTAAQTKRLLGLREDVVARVLATLVARQAPVTGAFGSVTAASCSQEADVDAGPAAARRGRTSLVCASRTTRSASSGNRNRVRRQRPPASGRCRGYRTPAAPVRYRPTSVLMR